MIEDPERRILDERARLLARPVLSVAESTSADLLFFSVGEEQFAIEARFVIGIGPMPEITPVPDLPAVFLGVVNHAGEVLTVIDLLGVLSDGRTSPGAGAEPPTLMVVLGEHGADLGIAVHDAERIGQASDWQESSETPLVRGTIGGHRQILAGDVLLRARQLTFFDPGSANASDDR